MYCTFLASCASGIINHTLEDRHKQLLGECFSTEKAAFLYEARCADLQASSSGNSKFCIGIQGFNPEPYKDVNHTYHYKYPKSWQDYASQSEFWDEKLFKKLWFEKQRSIIAPLDIGTRIGVVGVYEYPRGETGHVLIVRAKVMNGEYIDTEIELPSVGDFSDTGPHWTTQWFYNPEKIEFSNEYLRQCGE